MTDELTPEQLLDAAYRERAHLVAWLAAKYTSVIAPAPDVDEPGWQIVFINVVSWQCSWHIAPRDADLFENVPHVAADDPRAQWDGHTTEEKYARIRRHLRVLWSLCGPECCEAHTYTGRCEQAPDDTVIVATEAEVLASIRRNLADLGITYAEVEAMAARRDFTTAQAHALWTAVGGTVTAGQVDADTVASRAAQVISSMGAEIRALKQERNRYRNAWHNARARAADARDDVEFTETAAVPAAARPRTTGQREDDSVPTHEIWSPHCEDGCCL